MMKLEAYRNGRKVGQWSTLTRAEALALITRGNLVGSYTSWELWSNAGREVFAGNSV